MPPYLVTVTPLAAPAANLPVQLLYLLDGAALDAPVVAQLVAELLYDPVVHEASWQPLVAGAPLQVATARFAALPAALEIAYRPGVTDNEAESILIGARRAGLPVLEQARTLRRYHFASYAAAVAAAGELANDLVQTTLAVIDDAHAARYEFYSHLLAPPADAPPQVAQVALRGAGDDELLAISRQGVLALDLAEMQTIRDYFAAIGRDPTDGELETIAQTWSEHCSHKTFKARVLYRAVGAQQPASLPAAAELYPMLALLDQGQVAIDSMIKTFLMAATDRVLAERTAAGDEWVLSAFVDNAGIIAFTDDYEVSFKVETHNHPSALEPFGGANTGVGGVIRDVLGVSAQPIANTDVLCFGPPDLAEAPPGVLHPRRICAGVVAGVRDYGNKLGIPTVNGAVLFDPGYIANPLVFCGTVGLAPRGRHPRNVQPGDAIVVLGGRTGRDGIHGATFSSVELTHQTAAEVGSAVQIGDPITEKKFLDVLLQARDQGLYNAITDCGAGGLSSAVGEMGAETGAQVELEHVPLKYAGLLPWEIWLSEAQERMVLAVPPDKLQAFLTLCAAEEVEATPIGTFTADQTLRVAYRGLQLVELAMEFLHDGRPQRVLEAAWAPGKPAAPAGAPAAGRPNVPTELLLGLLAHPNIASKERIVRTYDHEVGGNTVIKPLVGVRSDGPGDAAVLQPLRNRPVGLAVACGINPRYGQVDPYWMALACVDEALRNVVAVGGDPARTVILDNFCWGDPRQPDRMAGLVRAAAGCYDAAVAFGTPFISGKDSLNNEYRDANGTRVAIPPTLLISALSYVPDVRRTVTMDLKQPGNYLYLVGFTGNDLAGSHLVDLLPPELVTPGSATAAALAQLPQVDLAVARMTFVALHGAIGAGLVQACHDLSEGGLAVAAAEMMIAGELGLALDLEAVPLAAGLSVDAATPLVQLFGESPSRFLVEVAPADAPAFEAALAALTCARIGTVQSAPELDIAAGSTPVVQTTLDALKVAWHGGLDATGL